MEGWKHPSFQRNVHWHPRKADPGSGRCRTTTLHFDDTTPENRRRWLVAFGFAMGRPDPSHNHSELWATFVGSRGHVSSAWGAAPLCPIASGGPSDDSVLPWAEEPTIEAILDRREEQEARDEAERYGLTPDPEFLAYEKALAERAKSLPPPELGYDVVGLEAIDFGFELLPHDELEIAMIQAGQLCRMGFGWSAGCFRIRKIDQDWDQAIDSVVILRDDRRTALVKGFYDRSRADFSPRIRETSGAHGEDAVP